jgi:hypothetical protein
MNRYFIILLFREFNNLFLTQTTCLLSLVSVIVYSAVAMIFQVSNNRRRLLYHLSIWTYTKACDARTI